MVELNFSRECVPYAFTGSTLNTFYGLIKSSIKERSVRYVFSDSAEMTAYEIARRVCETADVGVETLHERVLGLLPWDCPIPLMVVRKLLSKASLLEIMRMGLSELYETYSGIRRDCLRALYDCIRERM